MSRHDNFRFIFLGDNKTGKTNIIQKFTRNKFSENYKETYGLDYYSKKINVNYENIFKVSIFKKFEIILWDTNGKENSSYVLPKEIYKNSDGFFICCSYDNINSLTNILEWLNHIKSYFLNENEFERNKIPIFILCNKCELPVEKKKFGKIDIKNILNEFSIMSNFYVKLYDKISAKDNINIDHVFERMATFVDELNLKNINNSTINDRSNLLEVTNNTQVDINMTKIINRHSHLNETTIIINNKDYNNTTINETIIRESNLNLEQTKKKIMNKPIMYDISDNDSSDKDKKIIRKFSKKSNNSNNSHKLRRKSISDQKGKCCTKCLIF